VAPAQLDAGVSGGEPPIGFQMFVVAVLLPCERLPRSGSACPRCAKRGIGTTRRWVRIPPCMPQRRRVQPASVFGSVVPFEPFDELTRTPRLERLRRAKPAGNKLEIIRARSPSINFGLGQTPTTVICPMSILPGVRETLTRASCHVRLRGLPIQSPAVRLPEETGLPFRTSHLPPDQAGRQRSPST
jgi:hypothetical protein